MQQGEGKDELILSLYLQVVSDGNCHLIVEWLFEDWGNKSLFHALEKKYRCTCESSTQAAETAAFVDWW